MTQIGVLSVLHRKLVNSLKNKVISLPMNKRKTLAIRATGQVIQICSGNAWITYDGEDILLEAGQETQLLNNRHEVIISAIGSSTVTFALISSRLATK